MKRISSGATFWYKRVFPALWFGVLLSVFGAAAYGALIRRQMPPDPVLIVPAVMIVFGYFMMKALVFDLVDEVLDAGDALIVRNGRKQERVALSDIMNVSYTTLTSPARVTVRLRRPNAFGTHITFTPPLRFAPFSVHPLMEDLIERIDAARAAKR